MARTARIETVTRTMMVSDEHWPHLVLPLKRWVSGLMETAYLMDPVPPDTPLRIYRGNMFMANPREDQAIDYASVEACLADGWEVD